MPLDRSPGIDEETIRVTSRFAVVRPVARMRPLEKHRHRAAKRLDVVVDIAERGPDVFRRMALATEPGERGLAEFERRFHRTSLARKLSIRKLFIVFRTFVAPATVCCRVPQRPDI